VLCKRDQNAPKTTKFNLNLTKNDVPPQFQLHILRKSLRSNPEVLLEQISLPSSLGSTPEKKSKFHRLQSRYACPFLAGHPLRPAAILRITQNL
jgi:hypothetical protein